MHFLRAITVSSPQKSGRSSNWSAIGPLTSVGRFSCLKDEAVHYLFLETIYNRRIFDVYPKVLPGTKYPVYFWKYGGRLLCCISWRCFKRPTYCTTVPAEAEYNFSYFRFLFNTELRVPVTGPQNTDVYVTEYCFNSTGSMYSEEFMLLHVFPLKIEPLTQIIESLSEWDRQCTRCNGQSYAETKQICGRSAASCSWYNVSLEMSKCPPLFLE